MAVLTPVLTGGNGIPTYNLGIAETYSWIPIQNDQSRPMYARAGYITNLKDLTISLSASNLNIGNIKIQDGDGTGNLATVVQTGTNYALLVQNQDLTSTIDSITIGDIQGKTAHVTSSALNVYTINPVTSVSANIVNSLSTTILNPVLSTYITNPQIEIINDVGNSIPVNVTNNITTAQLPSQLDAFGRLRTSSPLTLFDSSHRYRDNGLWTSLTAVGGTYSFNANQGLVDLTVSALSGSSVIRETTKTFSYQPGKSLIVLNTFVMAPSTTNLRQRVGYFGSDNGIYFQLDDGVMSFVQRSSVSGSLVETVVPLSAWNGDKLNGTGTSGLTLDITKAQILWTDIEWLGVGTVRVGFIINGQYIVCHSFHHANIVATTYITTASLPLRYEITNKNATSGSNTLKQICSSVISEGGYELRGLQQSVGTSITSPYSLTTSGTFYPIVTLRLKSTRSDAIVILTALSFIGKTNGYYNWKVIASGTTSGGTWTSAGTDSAVEYKTDATSISGGRVLAGGYCTTSTQGSTQVDILKESLFTFQLERDSLNGINYELSLVASSDTSTRDVYGAADWEEISR